MSRSYAEDAEAPPRRAVWSWILYDLANTIFSMNIVSLYFSLWIVGDMAGRDGDYGLASSLSMFLVFLTAPLLGALSDHAPRRIPFLVVTTVMCCGLTVFLGTGGLLFSLALFVGANFFYQAGLIFYDALLPSVSTPASRGRVGGLGVGIGYLGSFIGVGMGLLILQADPTAKPLIFKLTGALFLLFALPCFLWVRERPRQNAEPFGAPALRAAVADLRATVRRARNYPDLRRFLFGRVFYTDAQNTLIVFMGIYVTREIGFTEQQAQMVLLVGIAAGIVGGILWGRLVDRIGARRTLNMVLGVWLIVFSSAAAIVELQLPGWLFWPTAIAAGLALGGTASADRPLMLQLAPPEHLGQFYGIYAMVGRFAAIMGPLIWTGIVDGLGWGRPAAVETLLLMVVIAYVIIRPIRDRPRTPTGEPIAVAPAV